jgi:hypothetical protein
MGDVGELERPRYQRDDAARLCRVAVHTYSVLSHAAAILN